MGKRCCVLLAALLAVLVVAFSLPSAGVRAELSGVLPWPLRFVQMLSLEGLQVKSIETALGNGPVAVSGTIVAGAPGAVPGGDEVAVLWRGHEAGRGVAAPDGSFSVSVPPLPDARVSILYGPTLPELGACVNVAAMVPGHTVGSASASSSYSSTPNQAFNQNWGDMWNAGTGAIAWVLRDLGREVDLTGVRLWFAGSSSQQRWARVGLSSDGVSFVPVGEGSVTARESKAPESPTTSFSLPAGTRARWVKVEADSGYDWTALVEVAVLGRVPAAEVLSAPEWTLPGGPSLSGRPSVVGQYGQPGLPWGAVSGWPDLGACWLDAARAATRFRVKFSVPAGGDACLYAVGDDSFVAWLDGVPVLSGSGTGTAAATPLVLPAGEHVLAFECSNAASPGGLLVSLRKAGGEVIVRSGEGDWEYEDNTPAWLLPGSAGDFSGAPVVVPKNRAWTAGPDPAASWIWCAPLDASGSHPAGTVRFRRPFALAAAATVTVSVAADNSARVWVDGVAVLNWQSYSSAGSASLSLPAGDHVLAVEAVNFSAAAPNPAGVLVSAKDASGAVLFRTGDSGWQTSGYVP